MINASEVETLSEKERREIGQHFVFGFHGDSISNDIERLIKEYYVGNVILMRRNVKSFVQVRKLTQELQRIAFEAGHSQPLLIGIDQENGLVSAFSSVPASSSAFDSLSNRADVPLADRNSDFDPYASCGTLFPGALALASAGQPSITEEVYRASGKEMKLAGINWAYAPVADVNTNPLNPVIGVRSFGDDAHRVTKYVQAAAHGLSSSGIAPCAKHFPGHGDTHVDSHLALPLIDKSIDRLTGTELVPFMDLIRDGSSSNETIASIMTAHVSMPTLIQELSSSESPGTPASLSPSVTSSLLRERLGYEGVITTDCLEMDAISGGPNSIDGVAIGSVKALEAGADIVMICHRIDRQEAALAETYKALRSGRLSLDQLEESADRIRVMKEKFAGSWEDVLQQARIDIDFEEGWKALKFAHRNLSSEVRAASLAWVPLPRPLDTPLPAQHVFHPIASTSSVLLLTPQQESVNAAVDDEAVAKESGLSPEIPDTQKEDEISVNADATGVVSAASVRAGAAYVSFGKALASRTRHSTQFVYSADTLSGNPRESDSKLVESLKTMDVVIFTTRNSHTSLWQLEVLARVARLLKNPSTDGRLRSRLILVASCAPYDYLPLELHKGLKELSSVLLRICSPAAALCSFEFTGPALSAVAAALFGEAQVSGIVPVRL